MERERKQCKPKGWRTAWLTCVATAAVVLLVPLAPGSGFAQEGVTTAEGDKNIAAPDDAATQKQAIQATLDYWTPERMQQAIPMPMPSSAAGKGVVGQSLSPAGEPPGVAPGWQPRKGLPQPGPDARIEMTPDDPLFNELMGYAQPQTSPPFVPPGFPTDYGNYAPFNRWTWFGNYLSYPTSTIGKLFFRQNGVDYVCSGSVIQKNTIATAGHCVNDGANHWSTNLVFCPSYWRNAGGVGEPYPTRGCWASTNAATNTPWRTLGDIDYDIGCVVTSQTNPTTGQPIGNVTGWLGRAWNWSSRQSTFAWGYPQGAPFPGYHIIASASTEWYESDRVAGGQVSKYIGSDQTGGCSGGPWWFGMRHPNFAIEYADTDGSDATDPQQGNSTSPFINGINSHKRCTQAGCPAGTLFTQEQGSPQFKSVAVDGWSSEYVFGLCFSNGGT